MRYRFLGVFIALCVVNFAARADVATATATAVESHAVPVYVLNKRKSSLKFTATVNSKPIEGRFENFDAKIAFDPKHPDWSSLHVEVDLASVSVADKDIQEGMKAVEWLWVDRHPKAIFSAAKLERIPDTPDYYAEGELELRGVKMPVAINFNVLYQDETSAVVAGYATIQRNDFGVGQGQWKKDDVVKKTVRVEFRIGATKQ